jgi:catechol 2,3-dioxygenase-like lactoylglutathione lyase family enzyme
MEQPPAFATRRSFLSRASAFGAVLAAHRVLVDPEAPAQTPSQAAPAGDREHHNGPRILALELLTAAPLARMKEFYHEALGLRVIEEQRHRLTIAAGQTSLTFVPTGNDNGRPFYHFAFNIPENKIRSACSWQGQRTSLLPIPAGLRDADYPAEVVDYRHWNAHSIFFFDPAGNVVEYIARHDLRNGADGQFGSRDILYASEIAFVVDDVNTTATRLCDTFALTRYRGGDNQFRAIGDERGLLLVMRRGRVISFDAPERKATDVFRTSARIRAAARVPYAIADFPYEITVER